MCFVQEGEERDNIFYQFSFCDIRSFLIINKSFLQINALYHFIIFGVYLDPSNYQIRLKFLSTLWDADL